MWSEDVQNEISRLLPDLGADVPVVRQKAAARLHDCVEELAKAHVLFPMPDALKPTALLALSQGIRLERDSQTLGTMARMASLFGTGAQTPTQTPAEKTMTDALIERMNDPAVAYGGHVTPQEPGWAIIDAIEHMGVPARLKAMKENRVEEQLTRNAIVYHMAGTDHHPFPGEGLHAPALKILADSPDFRDWMCLCYNLDFWIRRVSREELKEALVAMWKKAEGHAKREVEEALHKAGFSRVLFRWV